ncbi:YncE family protein [Pseudonocardia acaciae]|uniref:YncE family protein n=1 Tax=Pseudonocardia acaciae TaxID=551276 RepID=UPI0012EE947E|nr:hypothetical protein [Pseudonocardia acaciae]
MPAKNEFLVTCNQLGHTMIALDAHDLTEVARVRTPPEPHMVVFDAKRALLYIAITYRDGFYDVHGDHGTEITVVNARTWTIDKVVDIGPYAGPHDMYLDPRADLLYVACESHGGCVAVLDLDTLTVAGHIPTEAPGPHWIAALPDGTKAYTGNKEAEFVSVLDLKGRRLTGKIPMPDGSEDLELSADGRHLYANDRSKPFVHIVDTATDQKICSIELPDNPHRMHVTSTGLVVISHFHLPWSFAKANPGSVSIVDPRRREVLAQVQVGAGPLGISSSPDARRIFVDNANDGTMTVIDATAYRVERVVPLDRGAHEVIHISLAG